MRDPKRNARSRRTREGRRTCAVRPGPTTLSRVIVLAAAWLGVVVLCACDTSPRGADRSTCEAYVASVARCSGPRIAERTRASIDAALARPSQADAMISSCGAQRERLPPSCR